MIKLPSCILLNIWIQFNGRLSVEEGVATALAKYDDDVMNCYIVAILTDVNIC